MNMRTVGLNHSFVALCFAVQLAECCFGKFSMRVLLGKKKANPLVVFLVVSPIEFVIAAKLRTYEHVSLSSIAAARNKERLLARLDAISIILLQPAQNLGLELSDAMLAVAESFLICDALSHTAQVVIENGVQAQHWSALWYGRLHEYTCDYALSL